MNILSNNVDRIKYILSLVTYSKNDNLYNRRMDKFHNFG